MSPDFGRVVMCTFPSHGSEFDQEGVYIRTITLGDVLIRYDDCYATHSIVDLEHYTLGRVMKTNPIMVAKFLTILQVICNAYYLLTD